MTISNSTRYFIFVKCEAVLFVAYKLRIESYIFFITGNVLFIFNVSSDVFNVKTDFSLLRLLHLFSFHCAAYIFSHLFTFNIFITLILKVSVVYLGYILLCTNKMYILFVVFHSFILNVIVNIF